MSKIITAIEAERYISTIEAFTKEVVLKFKHSLQKFTTYELQNKNDSNKDFKNIYREEILRNNKSIINYNRQYKHKTNTMKYNCIRKIWEEFIQSKEYESLKKIKIKLVKRYSKYKVSKTLQQI